MDNAQSSIPVEVSALEMLAKCLQRKLEEFELKRRMETIGPNIEKIP